MTSLNDQELARLEALNKLREIGIEPFPAEAFEVSHLSEDIQSKWSEEVEGDYMEVSLAGRLMMKRIMGKASFGELQDSAGRIQIYVQRDDICPEEDKTMYNDVFKKLLDIGDYIVAQTGYIEDSPTTNFSHSLWFPYKLINKGDLVVVYTKSGSSKERVLDKGNKAHFFYLGLTEPIWNAPRHGALILHAPSWDSKPAEALIRK